MLMVPELEDSLERAQKKKMKDMTEERVEAKPIDLGEYKFGFHDDGVDRKGWMNRLFVLSAAAGMDAGFRLKSYESI